MYRQPVPQSKNCVFSRGKTKFTLYDNVDILTISLRSLQSFFAWNIFFFFLYESPFYNNQNQKSNQIWRILLPKIVNLRKIQLQNMKKAIYREKHFKQNIRGSKRSLRDGRLEKKS